MFKFGFAVEWVYLRLIALWLGGAAVGGRLVRPSTYAAAHDTAMINRHLTLLSHAATIALFGIFATGVYNAFQRVGTVHNVMGNPYGKGIALEARVHWAGDRPRWLEQAGRRSVVDEIVEYRSMRHRHPSRRVRTPSDRSGGGRLPDHPATTQGDIAVPRRST